jgi:hypothetical protein
LEHLSYDCPEQEEEEEAESEQVEQYWNTLKKMPTMPPGQKMVLLVKPSRKMIPTVECPASCQQASRLLAESTKVSRKLERIE